MGNEKATTFLNETFTLICPCHFGLESVLKREIQELGYEISLVEDGKVSFGVTGRQSAMRTSSCALQRGCW